MHFRDLESVQLYPIVHVSEVFCRLAGGWGRVRRNTGAGKREFLIKNAGLYLKKAPALSDAALVEPYFFTNRP
jgi:hypothetical protein